MEGQDTFLTLKDALSPYLRIACSSIIVLPYYHLNNEIV